MGLKIKILFKKPHVWACWGQKVGPNWAKNGKKGYFQISHLTPNLVFPKFLTAIVS